MPYFVYSYDLKSSPSNPHRAFVEAAINRSMTYVCMGTDRLFRFPNTTLWGYAADMDGAEIEFNTALVAAVQDIQEPIEVESRLILPFGKGRSFSYRNKKPEQSLIGSNSLATCCLHQLHDPFFRY